MSATDRDAGYITLSVLLVSGFLAAVVVGLLAGPRPTLGRAVVSVDTLMLDTLLDSGLHAAAYQLMGEDSATGFSRSQDLALENGHVATSIVAEGSRIDLNASDLALIEGIFEAAGARSMSRQAFADRISDWRGDGPARQGRTIRSVAALAGMENLSAADHARLTPFLTVHNPDGLVDVLSAPPEVLMAVPEMTRGDAERIVTLRGSDAATAREDLETLVSEHGPFLSLDRPERFRLVIDATLKSGMRGRAEAVIDTGDDDGPVPAIIAWARAPMRGLER